VVLPVSADDVLATTELGRSVEKYSWAKSSVAGVRAWELFPECARDVAAENQVVKDNWPRSSRPIRVGLMSKAVCIQSAGCSGQSESLSRNPAIRNAGRQFSFSRRYLSHRWVLRDPGYSESEVSLIYFAAAVQTFSLSLVLKLHCATHDP
jgi:hypothetical protein